MSKCTQFDRTPGQIAYEAAPTLGHYTWGYWHEAPPYVRAEFEAAAAAVTSTKLQSLNGQIKSLCDKILVLDEELEKENEQVLSLLYQVESLRNQINVLRNQINVLDEENQLQHERIQNLTLVQVVGAPKPQITVKPMDLASEP